MTQDVLTVSPDLSVREAMDLLTSRHISGAPVVI
ncbi:MAG: CBS domain-containing protein, partial [Gemmatimonadaceae bacterium]